jgi:hypothetical protein
MPLGGLMRLPTIALIAIGTSALSSAQAPNLSHRPELLAFATPDFPYAGFWKPHDCTPSFGLAISPTTRKGVYSVSFCGPSGCFEPGTYRPNTRLVGDDKYWVIDMDTIEVLKCDGSTQSTRYVRCPGREVP